MSDPNQDEAQKKAERDKLDRLKMEAMGFDPDNRALFDAYQKNQDKVAVKQITQQDALRDMHAREYQEADKQRRDGLKQQQDAGQQPAGNDSEAKRLAYVKDLEEDVKTGRIDEREKVYRERRFDNQLAMDVKFHDAGQVREITVPRQEPPQQHPLEADNDNRKQGQQEVNQPMDWERMLTDPAYRKQLEQQTREERAARLQQMQQERGTGSDRSSSGGRERG